MSCKNILPCHKGHTASADEFGKKLDEWGKSFKALGKCVETQGAQKCQDVCGNFIQIAQSPGGLGQNAGKITLPTVAKDCIKCLGKACPMHPSFSELYSCTQCMVNKLDNTHNIMNYQKNIMSCCDPPSHSSALTGGEIAGIVIGIIVFLLIVWLVVWGWRKHKHRRSKRREESWLSWLW